MFRLIPLCLLVLGWSYSLASAAEESPNIVFILADDLSWSDLACYGNEIHRTPNLDRLAAEGTRFTQAYSPAPICSASRAAILTGKAPSRLHFEFVTKEKPGGQDFDTPLQSPPFTLNLPLEETTLGELLSPAGVATGFYGKWHVSQHYQGYLGWSPTHGPLQQGFAEGTMEFGSHPYAYRSDKSLKNAPVAEGEFPEDALVDQAIGFLEEHQDEHFFLYLSQYYVHDPVHSRCRWLSDDYRARLPEDALEIQADYGAMVETLDHLVGRVLDALDRLELSEDTLLVFMSDNGGHPNYTSNAPLRGSKWNLYEGGVRVPFLVRWPGKVAAGAESDALVHGCDLFPTFAEVAGADLPTGDRDGVSLVPLWKGEVEAAERRQPIVWHFPYYHPEKNFAGRIQDIGVGDFETSQTRPHSAIRSGKWKLLHFHEDDRVELYDVSQDIAEQEDLAQSHPEVAAELRQELAKVLKSQDARFPTKR